jgi:hypothetical protein
MSKAQPGGYEFNQEVTRIRNATKIINENLLKILEKNPGPQTILALIAQAALQLPIILDAAQKIEKIGKQAKKQRTEQED